MKLPDDLTFVCSRYKINNFHSFYLSILFINSHEIKKKSNLFFPENTLSLAERQLPTLYATS